MNISVISVPVANQEEAKRFYTEQLGFAELLDVQFGDGLRWIQLAPPGAQTGIALVTWFADMKPGSLRGLVLRVDDIDRSYAELRRRGVDFAGGIDAQAGGLFAYFSDPDGNGWMLNQPR